MYAALAAITLGASIVTGAMGYGFSAITVPLALLFLSNRVLNPALVLVEVGMNAYMLWVNRTAVPPIVRRALPVVAGLVPGIVAGTLVIASLDPEWLKLGTFSLLLPLILLQTAGVRRPIRAERSAGLTLGSGVGMLYAVTTLSGPALALMLNNQGLAKAEFRAAMAFIRLAGSMMTAVAYAYAGLYMRASLLLVAATLPGVALGVPIGAWLIRQVDPEAFRRLCMSFDVLIVGIGIAVLLPALGLTGGATAIGVLAVIVAADLALLYRFFSSNRTLAGPPRLLPRA